MDPTLKTVNVELLNGKQYEMVFNINTYSAFESVREKFFLDFLVDLQRAFMSMTPKHILDKANGDLDKLQQLLEESDPDEKLNTFSRVAKSISIQDMQALIWASLHTYDHSDEPQWSFKSPSAMARYLDLPTLIQILPQVSNVISASNPPSKPKSTEEGEQQETRPTNGGQLIPADGGNESGVSDEDVLASLETNSGD